jgi:hypothetical protein
MFYRWSADAVILFHGAFVAFVLVGGFLALRWPRLKWIHLPAAVWGVLIEYAGWVCPLTPLENVLRARAGESGYTGGFVEHYVLRTLYPVHLTNSARWVLGSIALTINVAAYTFMWQRTHRRSGSLHRIR